MENTLVVQLFGIPSPAKNAEVIKTKKQKYLTVVQSVPKSGIEPSLEILSVEEAPRPSLVEIASQVTAVMEHPITIVSSHSTQPVSGITIVEPISHLSLEIPTADPRDNGK